MSTPYNMVLLTSKSILPKPELSTEIVLTFCFFTDSVLKDGFSISLVLYLDLESFNELNNHNFK